MFEEIPRSKWQRGLTGTKTAARMGQKALKYLAVKPFLAEEERLDARKTLDRETAAVLLQGLCLATCELNLRMGPGSPGARTCGFFPGAVDARQGQNGERRVDRERHGDDARRRSRLLQELGR